jgi:hypothetical protein
MHISPQSEEVFQMTRWIIGLVLIVLLTAPTDTNAQVFQSGKFNVDRTVANYSLDQGSGDRTVTVEINFERPFDERPQVALSVTTLDSDKGANTRFEVKTISVSRDGFVIQVRAWADTKIYSLGGSWMAYAAK